MYSFVLHFSIFFAYLICTLTSSASQVIVGATLGDGDQMGIFLETKGGHDWFKE